MDRNSGSVSSPKPDALRLATGVATDGRPQGPLLATSLAILSDQKKWRSPF